ncbi:nicotinate-nucleotide adenylyltransferase [Legionella hackeliae]|uniref:Probable nicotinate-nucleotide adenylyltransferase n=1 Tax=Legionella hackeliae TaxID=449 RepID=A0A0A8UVR2_LEGHA|nr:nicotinate-nucleotide adenylyltransferase [Legionella hackeliae]KTD09803.1 nicotinate-nucleotide adenylyltransferase NadD [Legionella hackeliae]CEK10869.1 putative nicotinate-nucleotide adenylyltransferase [Legionella hackeliae]STX47606.1 nicotinate-nucleotide adenylyltransferase NadD [Legionella hackeliae]
MRNLIIYGGTFDPVHEGHLKTANNIQNHFHFDQFIFLPCKIPVLKNKAIATPAQRIEMLELALKNQPENFTIDLSEINRESPSYMVSTLENFRQQLGENVAMTLLIGQDTFLQLPKWYQWYRLLDLANLLVIKRYGVCDTTLPEELTQLLNTHEVSNDETLLNTSCGLIYRYDAGEFNISSTWLRHELAQGKNVCEYLPKEVLSYIKKNKLYKSTQE